MEDKEVFNHFGYDYPPENCVVGAFPKERLFSELETLPDLVIANMKGRKALRITVDYDPEYPNFMMAIWL